MHERDAGMSKFTEFRVILKIRSREKKQQQLAVAWDQDDIISCVSQFLVCSLSLHSEKTAPIFLTDPDLHPTLSESFRYIFVTFTTVQKRSENCSGSQE